MGGKESRESMRGKRGRVGMEQGRIEKSENEKKSIHTGRKRKGDDS